MRIRIKGTDGRTYEAESGDLKGLAPAFTLEGAVATALIFSNAIILTGGPINEVGQALAAVLAPPAHDPNAPQFQAIDEGPKVTVGHTDVPQTTTDAAEKSDGGQ